MSDDTRARSRVALSTGESVDIRARDDGLVVLRLPRKLLQMTGTEGFCALHYQRWNRHGDPLRLGRKRGDA
jgi:hypothetical protein